MRLSVTCICILITACSCKLTEQPKTTEQQHSLSSAGHTNGITIFLTGNTLSALKPCGCSGGQLGGLEKRTAVFSTIPEAQRLVVDTGALVKTDLEQDRMKFEILFQALRLLNYDMLSLSRKDIDIIQNHFGTLDNFEPSFQVIAPTETEELNITSKFQKTLSLDNKQIDITFLTVDANTTAPEQISRLLPANPSQPESYKVNILIVNTRDDSYLNALKNQHEFIDLIICPATSDQPVVISEQDSNPLIASVGRFGRYVAKLQITPDKENALNIDFTYQTVTQDLPSDIYLVNLYKDYQAIVTQSNMLESFPRFIRSDGLKYLGSDSCADTECHAYEFMEWLKKPHAQAYSTLEEAGSQYDPECVICHVVGMEYRSGFITEDKTPLLEDVGCEVCHGPGSAHAADPYHVKMPIQDPNTACIKCHTSEHSDDYAGHEEEKLQLIKHWKEPNQPSNVK